MLVYQRVHVVVDVGLVSSVPGPIEEDPQRLTSFGYAGIVKHPTLTLPQVKHGCLVVTC